MLKETLGTESQEDRLHTQLGRLQESQQLKVSDNTCAFFTQSFIPSPILPSASIDDLVNCFSLKVMTIIDSIAPIRTRVLSGRKKAQKYYTGQSPEKSPQTGRRQVVNNQTPGSLRAL